MADPATPAWLTAIDIERAVRSMPGFRDASLVKWSGSPLAGGGGECLGVWRLEGIATVVSEPTPWSVVLKGWPRQETAAPPSAWNWPHREAELYRSGMLGDIPGGIRAPGCFGDVEREDGSVWVWLEDITDGVRGPWSLDRYEAIARRLGQFNGASLAARPLPDTMFLSRHALRDWVELAGPALEAFMGDAELARRFGVYPPEVLEAFGELWSQRHALYEEMARLPQVFGHLDAFSRNIFIRQHPGEPDDTILIDWSFAGIGAIGEELGPLVGASVVFMDAPGSDIEEMSEAVLEGYIAGLKDASWNGDFDVVRRVFHVAMALRYGVGVMRAILLFSLDPSGPQMIETLIGHPHEEFTSHLLAFNTWVARTTAPWSTDGIIR